MVHCDLDLKVKVRFNITNEFHIHDFLLVTNTFHMPIMADFPSRGLLSNENHEMPSVTLKLRSRSIVLHGMGRPLLRYLNYKLNIRWNLTVQETLVTFTIGLTWGQTTMVHCDLDLKVKFRFNITNEFLIYDFLLVSNSNNAPKMYQ